MEMSAEPCIYVGDFNIAMNNEHDYKTVAFKSLLETHNLENIIQSATHVSGNTIDLIIARKDNKYVSEVKTEQICTISDHKVIEFKVSIECEHVKNKLIKFRNMKNIDTNKFSRHTFFKFSKFIEDNICTHDLPNANHTSCIDCLTNSYRTESARYIIENSTIVEKTINNSRKSNNKWYNEDTRTAKINLRRAEKTYIRRKTEINKTEFTRLRQIKCKVIEEAKIKYYKRKIDLCKNNTKEMQKVVDTLTGKNINPLKLPAHENEKALAEDFKIFFVDKVQRIYDSFSIEDSHFCSLIPDYPLVTFDKFRFVDKTEIIGIMENMNRTHCSNDPYCMKNLNFDELKEPIAEIFTHIVNASFETGKFPVTEKNAIVRPLIKGTKDKDELSSYRPLYNTSILSKVLEKACLIQLSEHLSKFESIPKFQSAYRKNHSVETALCRIYNDLLINKSAGRGTLLIMLDLSAAFDTVNQSILLGDLYELGVDGVVLEWFRSYLVGRTFHVEIGEAASERTNMKTGLTQGTILSPILFTIYTIGLCYLLTNLGVTYHMYADDCQLLIDIKTKTQTENDCKTTLNAVQQWMKSRKLKLNTDKTEYIMFNNNNCEELNVDELSMASRSENIKDLGFTFNTDLNMKLQILNVKRKAIGNLINISKIAQYIDLNSRLKLIYGLVLSRIDFCNSLYVDLPNNLLRPLQIIINDCARLAKGIPRFSRERVTPICMELHFLPIKARIIYKICLLMHKVIVFGQPSYLAEIVRYREPSRTLRHSNLLEEPMVSRSQYSNRSFKYCAPRLYNALPLNVRESRSIEIFKRNLKTYLYMQAYDSENRTISSGFAV